MGKRPTRQLCSLSSVCRAKKIHTCFRSWKKSETHLLEFFLSFFLSSSPCCAENNLVDLCCAEKKLVNQIRPKEKSESTSLSTFRLSRDSKSILVLILVLLEATGTCYFKLFSQHSSFEVVLSKLSWELARENWGDESHETYQTYSCQQVVIGSEQNRFWHFLLHCF